VVEHDQQDRDRAEALDIETAKHAATLPQG
jgi:hypothetical protein